MKKLLQIFIAIIPLIVSFSTSDPTLAIRFLAFSCIVSGVLFYYLLANKSIYKEVVTHPAMLAFAVVIITYTLSVFYNGFGSESIYMILKLFLSYVFAIILVQFVVKEGYKPLLHSFVCFSLFLSAIYFYQFISSYSEIMSLKGEWERNHAFDALAGTMGHKNLLSSIQFLMLPILIYTITIGKKVLKILSGLAILLILITLFQTQTRAVLFALGIFSVSIFILNKTKLHKKHFIGLLVGAVLLLGSGYAVMKYTNRYDAFISEINKTLDFTSSARYKLYNSSLKLIAEQPIFGVGPGNWKIDVWEYGLYEGTLGKSFAQRPHNDFLWVFAEGGFIAGISYLLFFLILLRDSYYLHKNRTEEDGIFYSLLFSCFLGFGFISFVDFPLERFSHNIIFFTLASFVIAGKIKTAKTKIPNGFKLLLISVSCFCVYVASIRYQGEIHAANAIHYKSNGNWNYVIKAIDKAYNPTYYEMENTSTPLLWYRGVAYFNQQKYDLALKDFKDAYKTNPYHVHVLNNLATSYQMRGDSEKAKKFYRDVFKVNPTFKETRVNLAAILYNERKYTDALDIILQSKVDPYWKRKKNNDNYDLYLKTIVNSWINSVYINTNNKQKKALDALRLSFDKKPQNAAPKMIAIFKIRQKEDVDYLTALMLRYHEVKQKKNENK
ncbi:O-antigen ligase family protein [Flavobacteriales bacterium]|nr:O-antigen ligase family protein [Flavobacteriales bacterium]